MRSITQMSAHIWRRLACMTARTRVVSFIAMEGSGLPPRPAGSTNLSLVATLLSLPVFSITTLYRSCSIASMALYVLAACVSSICSFEW